MKTRKTYLQWVGSRHYSTIEMFCNEVSELGISKRLPNFSMVTELAKKESIIFLVHNENKTTFCLACSTMKKCSACHGLKPVCPVCQGLGAVEYPTGGYAIVDGEHWDYTKYIKLRRQPQHEFWSREHAIGKVSACQICAGQGQIPVGQVFGFYVPEAIEYILTKAEDESRAAISVDRKRVKVVTAEDLKQEAKRCAGYRKPGGFYAVTSPDGNGESEEVKAAIDWVEGVNVMDLSDAEVIGNFVRFASPLSYTKKQFRGLKRWDLQSEGYC